MELYEQLVAEKGAHMAVPDVLITGVGTRIHHMVGGHFVEDSTWTTKLDEEWNLQAAQVGFRLQG